MALKRNPEAENELVIDNSISGQKAKQLFSKETKTPKKENKVWAKPSVKTGLMKNNEYFYAT